MAMSVEVRISLVPLEQIIRILHKQCMPGTYHIWHFSCSARKALLSQLLAIYVHGQRYGCLETFVYNAILC